MSDRMTGQQVLAKRFGKPAAGMAWCSGFHVDAHQVPADDIYPGTCRCRPCKGRSSEQYRTLAPKRVESRVSHSHPSQEDDRYVEPGRTAPGNAEGAGILLRQWGYTEPERDRSYSQKRTRHNESRMVA